MGKSKFIVIPAPCAELVSVKAVICLSLLLWSFTVVAQTKMSPSETHALKALVKTTSEETKTITSDFVQYQHLEFLSNDVESSGKLAFKSPNMVRWEYQKPDPYSILFKNEKLYIDQNGSKNEMDMGSNKIFKQLNQLITASITGDLFDAEEFTVSYFKKDGQSEVHFMPTDEQFAEFIKAIHITFSAKGEVKEVKMLEASEDYTTIVFSNRIVNQPLPEAVFAQ